MVRILWIKIRNTAYLEIFHEDVIADFLFYLYSRRRSKERESYKIWPHLRSSGLKKLALVQYDRKMYFSFYWREEKDQICQITVCSPLYWTGNFQSDHIKHPIFQPFFFKQLLSSLLRSIDVQLYSDKLDIFTYTWQCKKSVITYCTYV
jgi:hypothetical protein